MQRKLTTVAWVILAKQDTRVWVKTQNISPHYLKRLLFLNRPRVKCKNNNSKNNPWSHSHAFIFHIEWRRSKRFGIKATPAGWLNFETSPTVSFWRTKGRWNGYKNVVEGKMYSQTAGGCASTLQIQLMD